MAVFETIPDEMILTLTTIVSLTGRSRPWLISKIKSGELPAFMVGNSYRVSAIDYKTFKEQLDAKRKK